MGSPRKRAVAIGVLTLALVVAGIGVTSASARRDASSDAPAAAGFGVVTADTTLAATPADLDTMDAALDAGFAALALQALGTGPVVGGEPSADHASGPGGRRGPLMRFARGERLDRLIHAEATVDHPDDGIITLAVDHGTVTTASGGSLAVKRADGQTVSFTTDDETKVRIGRKKGDLDDVKAGAEILVQSRQTDEGWTAKRIYVIPPDDGEAGT